MRHLVSGANHSGSICQVVLHFLHLVVCVALAAGCSFTPPAGSAGGDARPDDSPGAPLPRRKPITIDHTRVPDDLTDFVMAVAIAGDDDLIASEDNQLWFSADDGTPLTFELAERATPRDVVAWVHVPNLSSTVDTKIYLNFDGAARPPTTSPWSAFSAMWHLHHNPAAAEPSIRDSAKSNHGTASASLDSAAIVDGKLGRGLRMNGVDQVVDFPVVDPGADLTIMGWLRLDSVAARNDVLITNRTVVNGSPLGIEIFVTRNGSGAGLTISISTQEGSISITTQIPAPQLDWHHFVWSYDGTTVVATVDDRNPTIVSFDNAIAHDHRWALGGFPSATPFQGTIDEWSLSSSLAPSRTTAMFRNQQAPGMFYSIGAAEPLP